MKTDVTFIGVIRKVMGARVFVELSRDLSSSPIIDGRVHRVGQVGSFVRVPLGFLNVFGIVSMVGASEAIGMAEVDRSFIGGQRWIEVQLVGEAYRNEAFSRGVSSFPTLDDEVHAVSERDLGIIYGTRKPSMIRVGTLAVSNSLPAYLDLDHLVTRHSAIVGSTGSGKSNMVAVLLKRIADGSHPNAQVVIVDPHGEYGAALAGQARVFAIGDATNPLVVPYWALSFDELAWFLVDRRTGSESQPDIVLRDKIFESRRGRVDALKAGVLSADDITPDSPVPFNLRQLWYDSTVDEHATLSQKDDWTTVAFRKDAQGNALKGSAKDVVPPQFEPPGAGAAAPFRSTRAKGLASYLNKIEGRLRDRNFEFLLNPGTYDGQTVDLSDLLTSWLAHDHNVTVLDVSGVPSEVLDLVVGVVTRILFEAMFWGRDRVGMGRQRPVLIAYEEAHLYLPRGGSAQFVSGYAARAVRRVFKEGRKYGIGAIVVSQRAAELDEAILAQCGTFFALRLANTEDQSRVRAVVPDSLGGLVEMLPALRTGEAIVLGEAVEIPSRVRFELVDPRPKSSDPETSKRWKEARQQAPYSAAVTAWRRQRMENTQG